MADSHPSYHRRQQQDPVVHRVPSCHQSMSLCSNDHLKKEETHNWVNLLDCGFNRSADDKKAWKMQRVKHTNCKVNLRLNVRDWTCAILFVVLHVCHMLSCCCIGQLYTIRWFFKRHSAYGSETSIAKEVYCYRLVQCYCFHLGLLTTW